MKVTLISSLPPQKGITPYTVHLAHALSARGIDLDALGFRSLYPRFAFPGGSIDYQGAADLGSVPSRRTLSWWNPFSWLRAGIAARGDIVHAQWWSWFLAPAYVVTLAVARRRGHRIIVTAHNVRAHEDAGWKQALNFAVLRQADHVITHSAANRQQLLDAGFEEARVSVVPMGIHHLPGARSTSRDAARAALHLPPNDPLVLLAGHIRPYKGARVLIEAMAHVRRIVPGARAMIAGELWSGCPDPRDDARACGLEQAVVARIGFVPEAELAILFAAADVVVLPYLHFDAQSAAGTMALSAGRALIVSETGGLPELVRDRRAIVPPGDAPALAGAIVTALTDPTLLQQWERDAVARCADLEWDSIAEQTARIDDAVLSPRTRSHPLREAA
jgi:glycosyltransferase involved in cell wall biosynthesis